MASRRDVLLALTNVLFAASGLGGLLTLYFDLTGRELAQVPPQYQRALGALLLLAALAFGLIEFSVTRDSRRAEGRGADQARAMVAGQVLAIIHSMDARLGYVEQVLAADQFAQRLQAVRERVAPALQETALAGYRELIQQQRASQLRQSFNGAPLHLDQAGALSSSLLEAGLDPGLLQGFLQCLSGVRDSSENLLAALQRASSADGGKAWIDHRGRRVELEWEILKVCSLLAHLAGLQALGVLAGRRGGDGKASSSVAVHTNNINTTYNTNNTTDTAAVGNIDVNHELQGLCHLEPRALMGREERRLLQEEHLARHGELMAKKAALEKEGQALLEQDLARYQEIDQQLVVRPTDGWSQVVGKAIALRQLGRTADSLAAFSRYGEMFAAADPGAGQYARAAQRLTMSMDALGVDGGVYIYELAPGGAAKSAGMQVGDVIVDYGGQAVRDMGTMVQALRSAPARDLVRAGYLRLREDGTFELRTASLPGEALGAGYMPI